MWKISAQLSHLTDYSYMTPGEPMAPDMCWVDLCRIHWAQQTGVEHGVARSAYFYRVGSYASDLELKGLKVRTRGPTM
jgi:hypothetical protein